MTIICGVDPGLSGALALLRGNDLMLVFDMPTEVGGRGTVKQRVACAQLADEIRLWRQMYGGDEFLAVIERTAAMTGQGVASMFSMGDTAGAIRGVFQTMRVRVEYVAPASWKKSMRLGADKDESRALAVQRWPDRAHYFARRKDHNRSEAALIAAYGWRMFV